MLRTEPQRLASKRNGSLSQGPITPQGRLASSRNATKHGLSGAGKHLPPDMEVELQTEIALYVTRHQPRDDYERDLIRRAALGNLRARRISITLNALTDDRVRNATRLWDESRASDIARLTDQLHHSPETAIPLLRRTAEGCDYLGDAWESLAQTLQTTGFWDQTQSHRALNLLGLLTPPPLTPSTDPLTDFWRCVVSLRLQHDPDHLSTQLTTLPDPAEALPALLEFVEDQIAALEAEGTFLWETYDLPSRQSASARAAFDTSPESTRLNRYLAAAERIPPPGPRRTRPPPPRRGPTPLPPSTNRTQPRTHAPILDPSPTGRGWP